MRHDAVLWIQWRAEILAVVFLFHWRTLNLLSEAIRLETFIECSLDFGCIGIEVFVDDVIHITCNGNLSLAYDTDKFSHTLMNVLADANMSALPRIRDISVMILLPVLKSLSIRKIWVVQH